MAKFTDAVVVTLKGYFNAGDQPTEAQFAALITAIQEGIEEHDHDATGDGDGINIFTGNLGIGADPGTGYHLRVYDNTLDTVATFIGASSYHIKTAGVTDETDNMMGLEAYMKINQAAGIVGTTVGMQATASIAAGEIGQSGTVKHLEGLVMIASQTGGTVWGDVMGMYPIVDVNAGTIGRDIMGMNLVIDVEAAVTSIGQNVYGLRVWMDIDKDPVGTVYGVHLTEGGNQDYGFYQSGSAPNYFGGKLGIGAVPAVSAILELSSTTGALLLSRMTTAQRDALTAVNGMIIYNTSTTKIEGYENGSWGEV